MINTNNINDEDNERYSRQLLLNEFNIETIQKLKNIKILVIGAGGLGSGCIPNLISSGIGTIGIVDSDKVELSNLHRQLIHTYNNIGKNKAESAKEYIIARNPSIIVNTYPYSITSLNGLDIASKYDMLIDCCDNPETRYLCNDLAVILNIPFISGAAIRWDGQFSLYVKNNINEKLPCYRCIHPIPPIVSCIKKCNEIGVFGTIPNIIGTLMSNEAVKYFIQKGESLDKKLFIFDGLQFKVKIAKCRDYRDDCIVCGINKKITKDNIQSYNYKQFIYNKNE